MLRAFLLCCGFGAVLLHAGPTESTIIAAMKLSDQPNYTWVATVVDDARSYEIRAQTSRDGYTRAKMPVVNAVRRRLGVSATDTEIDVIFRGNVRCVLGTDDGWKTVDELPKREEIVPDAVVAARSSTRINKGPPPRRDEIPVTAYSNLQLALSLPHEELAVIVTSHEGLVVTGNTATGTLSNSGAQLLLVRDGQSDITPLRASGAFKLWLQQGIVTRYQVQLEGTLAVVTSVGPREIRVSQKTDTTISQVGTTRFDVPGEARAKLE